MKKGTEKKSHRPSQHSGKRNTNTQITLEQSTKVLLDKVQGVFALQDEEFGKELDENTVIAILASGFLEGIEEESSQH